MVGKEFSAEGLFIAGVPHIVALCEKKINEAFVEIGHVTPAQFSPSMQNKIKHEISQALKVLGLQYGYFHIEFWIDGENLTFGEFHARPGGDFIHRLIEYSIPGFEYFGTVMDDLLGLEIKTSSFKQTQAAGIIYFQANPGIITEISGVDTVKLYPQIKKFILDVKIGDEIKPMLNSFSRHGLAIVSDKRQADVKRILDELVAKLKIMTSPDHE